MNGIDTGIMNPLSVGTAGQRISVFGTVHSLPGRLNFEGGNIKSIRGQMNHSEAQTKADILKRASISFDVPMELSVGDRVCFLYKEQFDSYKNGSVLYTDGGTMMLMNYDNIRAIIKGEDELYPLNGAIFIEPLELASTKKTAAGIELLDKQHMGMKLKREGAFGRVIEVGCLCNGYLDFPDRGSDDRYPLKKGDIIFYDGRMSNQLQFETHQTLKTKRLLLHRKDIHAIVTDPGIFEFAD